MASVSDYPELAGFPEPSEEMLACEPWRADPRWLAAYAESVSEKRDDETASDRFARGCAAHMEMYRVAVEYGAA